MHKAFALLLVCVLGAATQGQIDLLAPAPEPTYSGFATRQSDFQRVLLRTSTDSRPVVARVIKKSANSIAVELPDGVVQFVSSGRYQPTEKPFERRTPTQLQHSLRREFPDHKVVQKGLFIFVYNTTDEFCDFANQKLVATHDSVLKYNKRLNLSDAKPATPLVIVLFQTKDEFLKSGGPAAREVTGYYNAQDNRIYMFQFLFPGEPRAKAANRCEHAISHEAVHLILHNTGVQQRFSVWPKWISEGLAEYFVPVRSRNGVVAGNTNLIRIAELLSASNKSARSAASRWGLEKLGTGEVIKKLVEADDLDSYGYAIAWSLTHYLSSTRRTKFERYVEDVASAQPFTELPGPEINRFAKYFGRDLAVLEEGLVRHVRRLRADSAEKDREEAASAYLVIGISPNGAQAIISQNQTLDEIQRELVKDLGYTELSSVRFLVQKHPNATVAQQALKAIQKTLPKTN